MFAASAQTTSFIIDGEIVAVDAKDGSLKSFQELSNRARKAVQIHEVTIAVCLYAFDLVYLDGNVSVFSSLTQQELVLIWSIP